MENGFQSVGKALRISFDRAAVVFDKGSGKILHVHRVTVARRDHPHIADKELRDLALEAAGKFADRKALTAAEVLSVEPHELHSVLADARTRDMQMHVDVSAGRLAVRGKSAAAR